jgi:hypothetical protein
MNGGGMLAPKFKMAQRNYENTELTYLLVANRFPTRHNLELKKGDKIFITLVVSSK